MKISIAMATYNGAQYLLEQLNSFVWQTRLPDELVVMDDQSSDNTLEILHGFAKVSPFEVRIFVNDQRSGHGQNFSKVISQTTGELVFLSDQDDRWDPEKIDIVANVATEHPTAMCILSNARITDAYLSPTGALKLDQIRKAGQSDNSFVMGCCAAIRRDFLDIVMPIPATLHAHDSWIVGFSDAIGTTIRLEQPLQDYRRHGGNVSQTIANSTRLRPRFWIAAQKILAKIKSLQRSDELLYEYEFNRCQRDTLARHQVALLNFVDDLILDAMMEFLERRISELRYRIDLRKLSRGARVSHVLGLEVQRWSKLSFRNAVKDIASRQIDSEKYDPWKI